MYVALFTILLNSICHALFTSFLPEHETQICSYLFLERLYISSDIDCRAIEVFASTKIDWRLEIRLFEMRSLVYLPIQSSALFIGTFVSDTLLRRH